MRALDWVFLVGIVWAILCVGGICLFLGAIRRELDDLRSQK